MFGRMMRRRSKSDGLAVIVMEVWECAVQVWSVSLFS